MRIDVPRIAAAALQLQAAANEPLCAYLYDLDALQRHASRLVASLPERCELFYAIKANSDLPILQTLAPLVKGFEVASGGELDWVHAHFPRAAVLFGGPGKTDKELRDALTRGVERIHVESAAELERLAWIARSVGRSARVLLRINLALPGLPATSLMMGGRPTPFGIDAELLPICLERLSAHPELELKGFHFHLVSHQLDARAHLHLIESYIDKVYEWQATHRITVDEINVGGGIGINYRAPDKPFDWDAFAPGLAALAARHGGRLPRLRFELGRYVSAACGYYVMEVLDVKTTLGRTYVVGRGGTHHFRTPYAQGHSHPLQLIPVERWPYPFARPEAVQSTVTVVGQLCTPKDVLATDVPVERVRAGDLLLFPYAGAYAWHISHHDFLRHPHPMHVYLPAETPCRAANE